MSIGVVHLGDIGTLLALTITENGLPVDLSPCTVKWIKIKRKDGTTYAVAAEFDQSNGTNGVLQYVFQSGELNVTGLWTVQGYVVMPNGSWHTATTTFEVKDVIVVAPTDQP